MKRLRLACASLALMLVLVVPGVALADVNDFTITSFESNQTLTRDDQQGELRIVEDISLVYSDNNHGILRAIPKTYKGHSLQLKINQVTSETGAPTEYSTFSQNGNTVLKIGDPDRTVTGAQQYTIDYTVHNVIGFYDDHDELYWDVNGDQWGQRFEAIKVTLNLPEGGLVQTESPSCYTGSYGETGTACVVTSSDNPIEISTTETLYAGQNLTYVASFEKGYFEPSAWYETVAEYLKYILGFAIPFSVIAGSSWWLWWRKGRDPKGRGTIVAQYDVPDNLRPMAVGAIMDFTVDNRDITATIIDLAVRGYIRIIEKTDKKLLRKDTLSHTLELRNADFSQLNADEKKLMEALFTNQKVGAKSELTKSKSRLYTAASSLRTSVKKDLTTAGYFRDQSRKARISRSILAVLVAAVGVIVGIATAGGFFIGGLVAGFAVGFFFWMAMDARTLKGVAAREHIEGLKLYLNTAEKDRIAKLQSPNAPYAAGAGEPERTVELFEKLLPFAIVLGVEKEWAKQFESLYTTPPDWYSGHWTTFNSAYLASSISSGVGSAVNSSFTPPSSSSSSGSGGGGFSGGGGGGGGGGGW